MGGNNWVAVCFGPNFVFYLKGDTMNKNDKLNVMRKRLFLSGLDLDYNDVETLRRCSMTLDKWAERECGDSNDYASWCIERDEATDKPYLVTYPHTSNKPRRHLIPDREKGALKRVGAICKKYNLFFYHQTDPRGCSLYISKEPLTDSNYTNGFAVCD